MSGKDFTFLHNISYTCLRGYSLVGVSVLQCNANGQWSSPPPKCVPKSCPSITAPPHSSGLPIGSPLSFGSSVTFSCLLGYTLKGSANLVCQDDGQWSDDVPACVINRCPKLSAPPNGKMRWQNNTFQGEALLACKKGYKQVGGQSRRVCQHNSTWSGSQLQCSSKGCQCMSVLPDPQVFSPKCVCVYV